MIIRSSGDFAGCVLSETGRRSGGTLMDGGIGIRSTAFLSLLGELRKGVGSDWCNCLFAGMIARRTGGAGRLDDEMWREDVEAREGLTYLA
jgi:hypothetical protein